MTPLNRTLTIAGAGLVGAAVLGMSLAGAQESAAAKMSFFITSAGSGKGGDLGGLAGADAHCTQLARAAGSPASKTWRAYLSASGAPAVNARDRIGRGPWFNSKGVQIATSLDDLHSENAKTGKEGSLDEKGAQVKGRGDTPNTHDILTGSDQQGRLAVAPPPAAGAAPNPAGSDMTCMNWTSSANGRTMVGHHDRQGGGQNPTSWNSAHASGGCSQESLVRTGGAGLFYCFATN